MERIVTLGFDEQEVQIDRRDKIRLQFATPGSSTTIYLTDSQFSDLMAELNGWVGTKSAPHELMTELNGWVGTKSAPHELMTELNGWVKTNSTPHDQFFNESATRMI